MTTTPVLGIPYVATQQSQPDVTHNEAISLLQMALAGGAITIGDNTPPVSPSEGDVYVAGPAPTGVWAGRENTIAGFFLSQWLFIPGDDSDGTPITMGPDQEGLRIWSKFDDAIFVWTDEGASPGILNWTELTIAATPEAKYGELNISNSTTVTAAGDSTLKTNGDYTQITSVWDALPHGQNNGVTQQTNSITVVNSAVYRIEIWANVSSDTNNTKIAVKFAVDGVIGLVRRPGIRATTAGVFYNMAAHGFVSLNAGQVVTLFHAADKTASITWEDLVFSVNELKRT